jgi:hypothetical protein
VAHNIALARFAAGGYTDAEGLLSELLSVKASVPACAPSQRLWTRRAACATACATQQ